MIVPIAPQQVVVTKVFCSPYVATLDHQVYLDVIDEVSGEKKAGAFLGFGVRDDRGFTSYAQKEQLSSVKA